MVNSDQRQFDIVIVGGGLAGISMVHALREYPGRVALVDQRNLTQAAEFSPPLRAIALSDSSHRIFSALGLWDEMAPHAFAVRCIHVSEKDVFGTTKIDAHSEKFDSLAYVVTNVELLRALYRANKYAAKATLFSSHTLTDVQRKDGGLDISLRGKGKPKSLSARLLIVADGGGTLSTELGFTHRQTAYRQTARVVAVETERAYDGVVYERFSERGLFAVLPLDGAHRRVVVWVMRDDEPEAVADLSDDKLAHALCAQLGAHVGGIAVADKHFSYPLELRYVPQPARDSVVLIGDAAHSLHPIAGQSFNLSLRDIAFLAEQIVNSDRIGVPDMLAAYCRARVRDTQRVVRFTDGLARIAMCPMRSAAILRGAGLAVFNVLPPLRRFIVRRSLGLSPPYSRLACGMPSRYGN